MPALLSVYLYRLVIIFMLTFAKLRCLRTGCSDAHCFAASSFWSLLMFLLSLETTKETQTMTFHFHITENLLDGLILEQSNILFWGNSCYSLAHREL